MGTDGNGIELTTRLCASRFAGVTAWTYLSIVMLAFACRINACVVATSAPWLFTSVPYE
jgi:hypothetical protein